MLFTHLQPSEQTLHPTRPYLECVADETDVISSGTGFPPSTHLPECCDHTTSMLLLGLLFTNDVCSGPRGELSRKRINEPRGRSLHAEYQQTE